MKFVYNNPKLKNRRKNLRNNMTKPEQILWNYLKGKELGGYKFRRQHSIGFYIVDFYCPELNLGIEVDGDSHFTSEAVKYDEERTNYLTAQNIKIIRFTNTDIMENIEDVLEKISIFTTPAHLS